ncbi:MAG: hypothetical protein HY323_18250 [Betaproteobacteria bacterium]|nr:hypothetical protein [Betaproteobacteria bacterium]
MRTYLTAFLIGMAAALFVAGSRAATSDLPAQSSTQAGVTVKAAPRSLSGSAWEFEIVFDTHSGELTDDLEKTAVLIADGGASRSPLKWQGDPPGGHHRKGVLLFKPVSPRPGSIELRIQRTGEASPRSFRWQLK